MKRILLGLAALALPALSQTPRVAQGGILNVASYAFDGLPNSAIAQGSLFTVFLDASFPVQLQRVSSYPVPTAFGGFSMRVTVGGQTRSVLMFFVAPQQLGGILPSDTPAGTGELRVSYNGAEGPAQPIRVVPRSLGIFTINQAGSGPGVITNASFQAFTPTAAANPGETGIIWGTGIGPITTGDSSAPPAADQNIPNFEVLVGGRPATVAYRGRSPGLAGTDQINFVIPSGVTGCYVPVVVRIGDIVSNTVTIPVAANGRICSDPNGLSTQDLNLLNGGQLRLGLVSLSRTALSISAGGFSLESKTDSGDASFVRYTPQTFAASQGGFQQPSLGACTVFVFRGEDPTPTDPAASEGLDAGPQIGVTGPVGAKQLARRRTGFYDAQLGGGTPLPGGPPVQPDYLNPGAYTITGPGGTQVGAFTAPFNNPAPLTWTNRDATNSVNRSQGVTITWSGGDPASFAYITGASFTEAGVGASFVCTERVAAGRFTVPPAVLLALPPSAGDVPGILLVGSSTNPTRFNASGLDAGYIVATSSSGKTVTYQ